MVYFGGFFAKLGPFAGFSLHIVNFVGRISEAAMKGVGTLYLITLEPSRRVHPHTVIFRHFFLYIIRRKDQRSCDGVSGDIIFHNLGRKVSIVYR